MMHVYAKTILDKMDVFSNNETSQPCVIKVLNILVTVSLHERMGIDEKEVQSKLCKTIFFRDGRNVQLESHSKN